MLRFSRLFLGVIGVLLLVAVADQAVAKYSKFDECAIEHQASGHDQSSCNCACHQIAGTLPVVVVFLQRPLRSLSNIIAPPIDPLEALPSAIDHPPQLA
jgi:hypothetical protein